MHIDTARTWLDDDELSLVTGDRTADAIRTVLERLAELEAVEVDYEWGIRWTDAEDEEVADEGHARRLAAKYPDTEVVSREVRRGPWRRPA